MFCSVFRRGCDGGLAGADLLAGGGQHQPPVEHPRHPARLHRPMEVGGSSGHNSYLAQLGSLMSQAFHVLNPSLFGVQMC